MSTDVRKAMDAWEELTVEYPNPLSVRAGSTRKQPSAKAEPPVHITPNMAGLRTDAQFQEFMDKNANEMVILNFSSSWCNHCHKMLPSFISLASIFPQMRYGIAQVDYLQESPAGIEYTPTFSIFKKGRKVDEFYGANQQQLRDHLWLHSDS